MLEKSGRDEATVNENDEAEPEESGEPGFLDHAKGFVSRHKGVIIGVGLAVAAAVAAMALGCTAKSASTDDGDDDYEPDYFSDGEDEEGYDDETLSLEDAALIWGSSGMDEDYTLGYSQYELNRALYNEY